VLWSVGFWLFHGLSFWLGMLAFDIHAGPVAAYFTEAVVGFGVAIPAAPGFFGTFHASASWALSVFGVPDASSLAFAFGYHLGGFIPVTLIGLYYAGTIGLSLKDVGSSGERVEEAVERELPVAARVLAGRSGAAAERVADDVVAVLVNAPAKVNLSLRVGARRPDGFHDLQTLFQGIDLCDSVEVRREGSGIAVSVSGGELGPIEENLVTRAVRAYLGAAGPRAEPAPGIRVRLEKRIPVAAGLGGGSSDAAATLRALDRLFEGAVGHADLLGIAANLGSDVPFFLSLTPLAVGRGRGELLDALDPLPALPGLLVVPELPVPTGEAYAALDRARGSASPPPPAPPPNPRDWADVARGAHNDFEAVVAPVHPEVRDALAALRATAPLIALLSGSGSACFALYRTDHEAQVAQVAAASLARGRWRVAPFRTLAAWPKPTEL
jgi:4-diphosphocytidyl-2-C-methyl-D-erythritol kinase